MARRPLGIYVHVPFCASRCGYCDFVTYTAVELGGSHLQSSYAGAAIAEVRLAAEVLGLERPPLSTVFFGGGTPTLLPASELIRILDAIRDSFAVAPDLEVSIEANPDSVDVTSLEALRAGGFSRISFGMQSVRQHVLAVLDRTHTPGRAEAAVRDARAAGFERVNVDLMYGTPGETDDDWDATITAAIATGADHISAYALSVEPRTRLGVRVRRGLVASPDDDVQARRYLHLDDRLGAEGFEWYEVSNWARSPGSRCRHNLLYWRNDHWWGIGPGAHSHIGGTRWWNVRHPAEHARLVGAGIVPSEGRETCSPAQRELEDLMLGLRLSEGFRLDASPDLARSARAAIADLIEEGLLDHDTWKTDARLALTRSGRLLTDSVLTRLISDGRRDARGCVASPHAP